VTLGLFIPCYIDQLYPQVGRATLRLLEQLGHEVVVPSRPACCGQPMANSGFAHLGECAIEQFVAEYAQFEQVVCPSGSCTLHLKEHLEARGHPLGHRVHELCEFLHDVAEVKSLPARFPHRVGLHQSCHGLRGLGLGKCSEQMTPPFSKPAHLLRLVQGLELVPLERADECCGFGGTFSVFEPDVSTAMGRDRVRDHVSHGAEFITSADMSCLMHLGGLLAREAPQVKVLHIAEILAAQE
jgi:L-lactate dehydrogenase complex protein LldE